MEYYTIRDLRNTPKQLWEDIAERGEVVITSNGKPTALLVGLDGHDPEEIIRSVRQAQAMRAVNRVRLSSAHTSMTKEEIDAEITAARKELG